MVCKGWGNEFTFGHVLEGLLVYLHKGVKSSVWRSSLKLKLWGIGNIWIEIKSMVIDEIALGKYIKWEDERVENWVLKTINIRTWPKEKQQLRKAIWEWATADKRKMQREWWPERQKKKVFLEGKVFLWVNKFEWPWDTHLKCILLRALSVMGDLGQF